MVFIRLIPNPDLWDERFFFCRIVLSLFIRRRTVSHMHCSLPDAEAHLPGFVGCAVLTSDEQSDLLVLPHINADYVRRRYVMVLEQLRKSTDYIAEPSNRDV